MKVKIETIEEYQARGGKITVIPPEKVEEQISIITPKQQKIYSLDEGALLFGKKSERTKKEVKLSDVLDKFDIPDNIKILLGKDNGEEKK